MKKSLERGFITMIVLALSVMGYNFYQSYQFKTKPVSPEIQHKIDMKVAEVEHLIQKRFGLRFRVPIIISDDLPSKLYGVTTFETSKQIKIYLNKKRMKESLDYMIDDVIAHEYAHALMFYKGLRSQDDGHSLAWQKICEKLEGKRCRRYVDSGDVISGKLPF